MLKAPFPWFGGKSRVADFVWSRFGDVPNYVEPFFGSGAVLLARPSEPGTETVNDLDCYLANFWRSIKHAPDAVAEAADWPVNEADLLARHRWLLGQEEFRQQIRTDADYHDPKIAGWWVWGQCAWIGSGWCRQESTQLPHLGDAGRGINRLGSS
jgi:site-specific DNA-adenine methylase